MLPVFVFGLWVCLVTAQTPPQWWVDHSVTNANSRFDKGLVTVGQAKYLVRQAYFYLEDELSLLDGAGARLDTHYATFCSVGPARLEDDLRVLSLGQLKFLAKPFYDRIMEVQFDPASMNPAPGNYPWSDGQLDDADDAPATLGQLKFVFSFDLSRSLDADGIPDWWEANYGIDPLKNSDNSATDFDGDSILDGAEYAAKTDPTDYYNSSLPTLSIVSGDRQAVVKGESASEPVIVKAADDSSAPLSNAPLRVSLNPAHGGAIQSSSSAAASQIEVRTNVAGESEIIFHAASDYLGDVTLQFLAQSGVTNTVTVEAIISVIEAISPWGLFTGPSQSFIFNQAVTRGAGDNRSDQLSGQSDAAVAAFTALAGLTDELQKIVAGPDHVVALLSTGAVYTWGDNFYGQLGLNDQTGRTAPTGVTTVSPIIDIAAGDGFTCLLADDGGVYLCGDLRGGLLEGTDLSSSPSPLAFPGAMTSQVIEIAAAGRRVLARCSDGSVWAWGDNRFGQSDARVADFILSVPTRVIDSGATRIKVSPDVSLALMSDGKLFGWGNSRFGQFGSATADSAEVHIASNVQHFAAGNGFIAYVTDTNQLYTAGLNDEGQLGRLTTPDRLATIASVTLLNAEMITDLAAGDRHTVYQTSAASNRLYGFGDNRFGALGEGVTLSVPTPIPLSPDF